MRRSDWQARMWDVLQAARRRPFQLGEHDCARLATAVIDAMTGSAWARELDEIYTRPEQAMRIMAAPKRLEALVTERLGEPLPPRLARRGDLVALLLENGPALGICVGASVAVASDGVRYVPLDRAHCVWRVS